MDKAVKLPPRTLDRAFDDNALGGIEKLVFIVLCRRGNQKKIGHMSIERLILECGVSRSTITRALRSLRRRGRIVFEGRRGRSGVSQYALHPAGHPDPNQGSERAGYKGQNDLQNQNLNQKMNRLRPVESRGISVRAGSAVQIGDVTGRMVSNMFKEW